MGNRVPTFFGKEFPTLLVISSLWGYFIVFVCLLLWCCGLHVDLIVSVPEFSYLLYMFMDTFYWCTVPDQAYFSIKKYWKFFFPSLHENVCFGYSLEAPQQGISNELHNICFQSEIGNYSWLSLSRHRLSWKAYLEVKIWSRPKDENLTTGKKILWKRSFPQYFQYISNFKSPITYTFVKCDCSIYFFLNSAILIWRGMAFSKYFRESIGIRDNKSRLYLPDTSDHIKLC